MKVIIVVGALVLSVGDLTAQGTRADYYLDVPGQTQTSTPEGWFSPAPTGFASTTHQKYLTSLKLTLLSVDVLDFVYGDYFVYEVLIENTGNSSVALPWSPNTGAFAQTIQRTPAGYRFGSVSVHVESAGDEKTHLALLDAQPLYGSEEVPGSLLVLAPGRTARIRAPSQWSATMPEGRAAILRQPEGAVRLRAVYSMSRVTETGVGVSDEIPYTRSTNTIAARVTPRRLVD